MRAEELTGFDRAYLRSLYDWIPNLPGISKLPGINRQLRLAAAEEDEAARAEEEAALRGAAPSP